MNKQKLKLNRDVATFCGHELTRSGVRPDSCKVEAITKMPAPTDKKDVMRPLGMVTYLARFCQNLSEDTAPIRELLKNGNDFCWRQETHGAAFDKVKNLLSNAPCLAYFNTKKTIVVQCDASQASC